MGTITDAADSRADGSLAELVASAAAGDERAWEALVGWHQRLLVSVVGGYRLGERDADDVVQTTWLALVQHITKLDRPEAVGAWLRTTAKRECLKVLRRRERERLAEDDRMREAADDRDPSPEDRAVAADVDRTLRRHVDGLPERCQALLRMLTADPPASYKEISETLGMRIGSIGPTRARCLQCLRRLLADAL